MWRFYTVPMSEDDPGIETWPNLDAAMHGGGQVWVPGSYDPETDLYIFGTGNPTPGYTGIARRGDNLFTCTLVAVEVSTGKMAWWFQTSPHDTHDWDSAQTPILIDGEIDGVPRKLVSTAARNGFFFTVDRVTGEHIVTTRYGATSNWASHIRESGSPNPNPAKEAIIPGALVSPRRGGRGQLAAARLQPRHRPLLHAGEQRLQPALPDRPGPPRVDGAGGQGPGHRGHRRQRLHRHRLPHRRAAVAPRVAHRRGAAGPAC